MLIDKKEKHIQAQIINYLNLLNIPYIASMSGVLGFSFSLLYKINTKTAASIYAHARKQGWLAGDPDIFILKPKKIKSDSLKIATFYGGLFLELKNKNGVVSKAQKDRHKILEKEGYVVKIPRSFEDAKIIIDNWTRA